MAFLRMSRRSCVAALTALLALAGASEVSMPAVARASGYLSICKQESGNGLEGIVFNFSAAGRTVSAPVGACSASFIVPAGRVTVTELARSGSHLVGISAVPAGRLAGKDIARRSATVDVVPGDVSKETIVTFTNRATPGRGFLKICKIAGSGIAVGTRFTFTADGRTTNVTAGPARGGGYCVLVDAFAAGRLSITETGMRHVRVSAIGVQPSSRLVARDLGDRRVTVSIGAGTTTVTYTNVRTR